MKKATFVFEFEQDNIVEYIVKSLNIECQEKIHDTNISIKSEGKNVILILESNSISGLRAGINSYLRWINEVIEIYHTFLPNLASR